MPAPGDVAAPLALEDLSQDFPHIPPEWGAVLVQSAVLCLEGQGHKSGALLTVEGPFNALFRLAWSVDVTEAMRRYWNDPDEAAEQGAHALAVLMLRALTGLTVLERSRKGTGFDWWLASEDNLFQSAARLEVSGIMRGTAKRVNGRLKERTAQTERSDPSGLIAFIAVVEFGRPSAKVIRR